MVQTAGVNLDSHGAVIAMLGMNPVGGVDFGQGF
jgi:hypothetical protein